MKKQINIEGMSCGHCVKHVTEALKEIAGVTNVIVNLGEKNAVIETEIDVTTEQIKIVIEDAGYEVTSVVNL